MVHGFKDGLKLAAKAMRTGEGSDVIGKVEQSYRSFTAENFTPTSRRVSISTYLLGRWNAVGSPPVALTCWATWRGFHPVPDRRRRTVQSRWIPHGCRPKLSAPQAPRVGRRGYGEAIADIVANPPENLHLAAVDAAGINVHQAVGEAGQNWQQAIGRPLVPA